MRRRLDLDALAADQVTHACDLQRDGDRLLAIQDRAEQIASGGHPPDEARAWSPRTRRAVAARMRELAEEWRPARDRALALELFAEILGGDGWDGIDPEVLGAWLDTPAGASLAELRRDVEHLIYEEGLDPRALPR